MKHSEGSSRQFGPFNYNDESGVVCLNGKPLALTGLPLRVLLELARTPGRIVARQQLKHRLWPQSDRIDVERRLNTAIRALRCALGDNAMLPLYIETVRGRGYRLLFPHSDTAKPAIPKPVAIAASVVLSILFGLVAGSDFSPGSGFASDISPVARDAYMKRVAQLNGLALRDYLDQFLEVHPEFMAAKQLRAQLLVEEWRGSRQFDVAKRAKADLEQLLQHQNDDPNILALLGELRLYVDWDWSGAEALLRRAIARDPWQSNANEVLAWLLVYAGDDEAAKTHLARVLSDPSLNADQKARFGWMYLRMGDNESAAALCRVLVAEQTDHLNALECAHRASADLGDYGLAKDYGLRLMGAVGAGDADIELVESQSATTGYATFLSWSQEFFWDRDGGWFFRAMRAASADQREEAIEALVQAYNAHDPLLVRIGRTQEFQPLHDDPRFKRIAAAVVP